MHYVSRRKNFVCLFTMVKGPGIYWKKGRRDVFEKKYFTQVSSVLFVSRCSYCLFVGGALNIFKILLCTKGVGWQNRPTPIFFFRLAFRPERINQQHNQCEEQLQKTPVNLTLNLLLETALTALFNILFYFFIFNLRFFD